MGVDDDNVCSASFHEADVVGGWCHRSRAMAAGTHTEERSTPMESFRWGLRALQRTEEGLGCQ